MFAGLYKEDMYVYGQEVDDKGIRKSNYANLEIIDLAPVSAHIGISYLFNLGF
jgi:hypothetical protein